MYKFDKDELKQIQKKVKGRKFGFADYIPNCVKGRKFDVNTDIFPYADAGINYNTDAST